MILIRTTLILLLISMSSYAQSDTSISNWVKNHPNVSLVEYSYYQDLSPEDKSLLGERILIFSRPLTIDQLEGYKPAHYQKDSHSEIKEHRKDQQQIKEWLAENDQIKIITQSEFKNFRNEDQEFYRNDNSCLILSGDFITLQDIENFE